MLGPTMLRLVDQQCCERLHGPERVYAIIFALLLYVCIIDQARDQDIQSNPAISKSQGKWKKKSETAGFRNRLGSISAALSCLVYPPREETAGRVSGQRKLLIKILAAFLAARYVI